MTSDKVAELVTGTARIEHNEELNGNSKLHQGKTSWKYRNGVVYDKEKGAEVEVNPYDAMSPYSYKYIVDLREKPVLWDQIQTLDPHIRRTKGLYMIKYTPRGSKDYKKGRPFKIGQDLIRWDIRVSGVQYRNKLCDQVPELNRLRNNSYLTENMFNVAAQHPGMALFFSIKRDEYTDKIKKQLLEMHEDASHPLVSRKVSASDYANIYKDNKELMIRYWGDLLKEINDTEKSPSVQEEMKKEVGETFLRASNKMERDPKTGRFIGLKEE